MQPKRDDELNPDILPEDKKDCHPIEVIIACAGTCVIVHLLIVMILMSITEEYVEYYFEKGYCIKVTIIVFILFGPFYAKRMKRSAL